MSEHAIPQRPPQRFNMAQYALGRAAQRVPEKPALIVWRHAGAEAPAELWTYRALEEAVLSTAAALHDRGLRPGDRLLIRLDNTSAYAILFFGAIAAGLVPIPTSLQLTSREAGFLLADSQAAAIAESDAYRLDAVPDGVMRLTPEDVQRMMRHARRASYSATEADDAAFLIYTSGTTAEPKGVLHAQRSAWGRRPMYQGWYGITPEDLMLHAGAFNWTYTLGTGLTDPWANAATAIVFTGDKSPDVWPSLITKAGATIFAAVPGLVRQVVKYGGPGLRDLGSLRHGLIAGETPPPGLFDDWQRTTGRALFEALGMSEISTYISASPTVPRRPGAIGKPQPGRRVAILPLEAGETPLGAGEDGLIAVHRSDPGLMTGYWNRPGEEAAVLRGGWFVGGDIGRMDADGYVTHLGRNNEIMKALGYRVSPLEVEAVLATHPDVAEVACTEIAVRADVSVIGAFIVPRSGAAASAEAIQSFAASRLAHYKCPRQVRFVPGLPRTANGKIQRAALKTL